MILITTAGKVGAEAARLLAAQGEPVRVLVRNPESLAESVLFFTCAVFTGEGCAARACCWRPDMTTTPPVAAQAIRTAAAPSTSVFRLTA
jgi:nucleoside-diphosphate-sugar epimerase